MTIWIFVGILNATAAYFNAKRWNATKDWHSGLFFWLCTFVAIYSFAQVPL